MSWLGLSPAAQRTGPGASRALGSPGPPQSPQAQHPASLPPQSAPRNTLFPRQPVKNLDLAPDAHHRYHSLDDFCVLHPDDAEISPQHLSLVFFVGNSLSANTTRASALLGWLTGGKPATTAWSHVAVAYVGSDGEIGVFEVVKELDPLYDQLQDRAPSTGVRLVSLRSRIVQYALKGEHNLQIDETGERIVKVGVMRLNILLPHQQKNARLGQLSDAFERWQDALKGHDYTGSRRALMESQLSGIMGAPQAPNTVDEFFCSMLSVQTYAALGIIPRDFPSAGETPSTLAAQTPPTNEPYRLGPLLETFYISVPRIQWDPAFRAAMENHRRLQQQQRQQQHYQTPYAPAFVPAAAAPTTPQAPQQQHTPPPYRQEPQQATLNQRNYMDVFGDLAAVPQDQESATAGAEVFGALNGLPPPDDSQEIYDKSMAWLSQQFSDKDSRAFLGQPK